jgi:hypothetical protein
MTKFAEQNFLVKTGIEIQISEYEVHEFGPKDFWSQKGEPELAV